MDNMQKTDLVIVGAGPGGLSAAIKAEELGVNYVVLEKTKIGSTLINDYPLNKTVTLHENKGLVEGPLWFETGKKELVLKKWNDAGKKLNVKEHCEVRKIKKENSSFLVSADCGKIRSEFVLFASGVRTTPRKLNVSGEELEKVFYKLHNPTEFKGRKILIVGGGDTACEFAQALSNQNKVTVSYRKEKFFRMCEKNIERMNDAEKKKIIETIFSSNVKEITWKNVVLDIEGKEKKIENNFVFLCLGGTPPTRLLEGLGIEISHGRAKIDKNLETNVKGVFAAGDVSGGLLIQDAINQGAKAVEIIAKRLSK